MRSNFFLIMLMMLIAATATWAQDAKLEDTNSEENSTANNAVVVLTRARQIEGELSLKTVVVSTSFGDAEFPLTKIEGIKLHVDEKDSCIFAFKNGDLVTGKIKFDKLTLKTDWGDANINVASIETIKLNPKGEFFQDSTAGKSRWRYGETREIRQLQNTAQPVGNASQRPNAGFRNNR